MTSKVPGAFNKLRFIWKRQINKSTSLSRSSKHLASHMCDTYVNKETGRCWPSNSTLATDLSVDIRTVQRHLKALEIEGWLCRKNIKGRRRVFEISFPSQNEHDTEKDNLPSFCMTERSQKHDMLVTPYMNQGDNQISAVGPSFSIILVQSCESFVLNAWKEWIGEKTTHPVEQVFGLLSAHGGFHLPARFPREEDAATYLAFLDAVMASEGAILPGKAGPKRGGGN